MGWRRGMQNLKTIELLEVTDNGFGKKWNQLRLRKDGNFGHFGQLRKRAFGRSRSIAIMTLNGEKYDFQMQ